MEEKEQGHVAPPNSPVYQEFAKEPNVPPKQQVFILIVSSWHMKTYSKCHNYHPNLYI